MGQSSSDDITIPPTETPPITPDIFLPVVSGEESVDSSEEIPESDTSGDTSSGTVTVTDS